ncbi:MAG: hypothetical protein FJ297_02370 [Planctomycetes bacterium]|nr:hypothetical protein [Planctomycetota bacterium]
MPRGLLRPRPEPAFLDNPLFVPMTDIDFVWDQVVDSVDDFFRIDREERLRLVGNALTEGRLETFPIVGSTVLEPWRTDATPGFERWQSSLQSIRRRASVRVTPSAGGLQIEVLVAKELEDLYQPEHATVGGATLRYDGTVVRAEPGRATGPVSLGWIPIGRDVVLEQRLLSDIRARVVDAGVGPR